MESVWAYRMSSIIDLLERHPELKVEMQAVGLIHDYRYHLERLKSILAKYDVKNPEKIEDKIRRGEIPEHPSYEDYLEALSHEENMREVIREIHKIVDALEAGLS